MAATLAFRPASVDRCSHFGAYAYFSKIHQSSDFTAQTTMPSSNTDPRLIPGAYVNVLVRKLTCDAECKRLYGLQWDKIRVTGVVQSVDIVPKTKNGRTTRFKYINCIFTLHNKRTIEASKFLSQLSPGKAPENDELVLPPVARVSHPAESWKEYTTDEASVGSGEDLPCTQSPLRDDYEHSDSEEEEEVNDDDATVFEKNERKWYLDKEGVGYKDLNGVVKEKKWFFVDALSNIYSPLSHENDPPSMMDCFLCCYPLTLLNKIAGLTNIQLQMNDEPPTSPAELLRFVGVMIIISRIEFTDRRSLWSASSASRYVAAQCLGQTGKYDLFLPCFFLSHSSQVCQRTDSTQSSSTLGLASNQQYAREEWVQRSTGGCWLTTM